MTLGRHCIHVIQMFCAHQSQDVTYNAYRHWDKCAMQMLLTHFTVIPANTKHLYNICTMLDRRRRRLADVVQLLYNVL